ncbi:hypothetical protein HAX54_039508, partial [Datura stramonium]|nr:hypothetical protein [Datura stramonium]
TRFLSHWLDLQMGLILDGNMLGFSPAQDMQEVDEPSGPDEESSMIRITCARGNGVGRGEIYDVVSVICNGFWDKGMGFCR